MRNEATWAPRGTRACLGGGAPWCLVGPLWPFFTWFQCQKIIYLQKPPKVILDEFLRRRKPLYQRDPIYSPFPAPCLRGEGITGGHLHHPGGLHDQEGVVHPRGRGFVQVAMCLISLSRVLEMARSWCIASFVDIDESYGVFPSLSSCDELSFPFEVFLSDWVFKDLRTLDVCLAYGYLWWQWDIHLSHLMYVLVINLRVPWPWGFMHKGWHTFSSWLSGRNFGALFEVLCVGLNRWI